MLKIRIIEAKRHSANSGPFDGTCPIEQTCDMRFRARPRTANTRSGEIAPHQIEIHIYGVFYFQKKRKNRNYDVIKKTA